MSEQTKIEWCDSTFNPWIGCTKISPACDHCYAEVSTPSRVNAVRWGAGQPRHLTKTWGDPKRWNKQSYCECMSCGWRGESRACLTISSPNGFYPPVSDAAGCPRCKRPTIKASRRRVFCASLADVFDNEVPVWWREDLFELIRVTPNLDWLLLTKRPQNINRMVQMQGAIADNGNRYLPDNVWLGTTVCNQEEADRNIPVLLKTREVIGSRVLFVSMEPLLGPVDLCRVGYEEDLGPEGGWGFCDAVATWGDVLTGDWTSAERRGTAYVGHEIAFYTSQLDWVIAGGESGHHARPSHPDWFRSLRDQCAAAGVPFLFKQWGEWVFIAGHAEAMTPATKREKWEHEWEDGKFSIRLGKKDSGRLLDGKEHNGFPEAA